MATPYFALARWKPDGSLIIKCGFKFVKMEPEIKPFTDLSTSERGFIFAGVKHVMNSTRDNIISFEDVDICKDSMSSVTINNFKFLNMVEKANTSWFGGTQSIIVDRNHKPYFTLFDGQSKQKYLFYSCNDYIKYDPGNGMFQSCFTLTEQEKLDIAAKCKRNEIFNITIEKVFMASNQKHFDRFKLNYQDKMKHIKMEMGFEYHDKMDVIELGHINDLKVIKQDDSITHTSSETDPFKTFPVIAIYPDRVKEMAVNVDNMNISDPNSFYYIMISNARFVFDKIKKSVNVSIFPNRRRNATLLFVVFNKNALLRYKKNNLIHKLKETL